MTAAPTTVRCMLQKCRCHACEILYLVVFEKSAKCVRNKEGAAHPAARLCNMYILYSDISCSVVTNSYLNQCTMFVDCVLREQHKCGSVHQTKRFCAKYFAQWEQDFIIRCHLWADVFFFSTTQTTGKCKVICKCIKRKVMHVESSSVWERLRKRVNYLLQLLNFLYIFFHETCWLISAWKRTCDFFKSIYRKRRNIDG